MLLELEIALGIYIWWSCNERWFSRRFMNIFWVIHAKWWVMTKYRREVVLFILTTTIKVFMKWGLATRGFWYICILQNVNGICNTFVLLFLSSFLNPDPKSSSHIYLAVTTAARYSKTHLRELIFTRHIVSIFSSIDFFLSFCGPFIPFWMMPLWAISLPWEVPNGAIGTLWVGG